MTGGTERIDELLRECARESFDEELSGLPEIPAGFSAAHELRMRGLFASRGRRGLRAACAAAAALGLLASCLLFAITAGEGERASPEAAPSAGDLTPLPAGSVSEEVAAEQEERLIDGVLYSITPEADGSTTVAWYSDGVRYELNAPPGEDALGLALALMGQ